MVSLAQLWVPILLSSVLVFVASSLIHMVFKWHNAEYRPFGNEAEVGAAMRKGGPAPGQYVIPYCADMKDMQSPEMQKKFTEGPVAFVTLRAPGMPPMPKFLGMWFALNVVIAVLTGYLASKSLVLGDPFLRVARITSLVPFLAYAGGSLQAGIWWGKPWGSVAKEVLDAFIYGFVTAVAFGMLWPH